VRVRARARALIRDRVASNTGGTIGFGLRQVCVTAGLPRIPPVNRLAAALASRREPSVWTQVALRALRKCTALPRGAERGESEDPCYVVLTTRVILIRHDRLRHEKARFIELSANLPLLT